MYDNQHPGPIGSTQMMRPAQVAEAFQVNVSTVTRWAKAGKIPFVRTIGGQRRYEAHVIAELLEPKPEQAGEEADSS